MAVNYCGKNFFNIGHQDKKNGLSELEDLRNGETVKFESILELGEKLYGHTSQDGREVIRNQLKTLRNLWDKISEDILNTSSKIDKCLQQFSDLTRCQSYETFLCHSWQQQIS
jgi:nesprin-1